MERMKHNQKCSDLEEENKRLEEENRKLKIDIGGVMGERDGKQMRIEELEEENKKLKEKLEKWEKDYKEGIIVHCRNG